MPSPEKMRAVAKAVFNASDRSLALDFFEGAQNIEELAEMAFRFGSCETIRRAFASFFVQFPPDPHAVLDALYAASDKTLDRAAFFEIMLADECERFESVGISQPRALAIMLAPEDYVAAEPGAQP